MHLVLIRHAIAEDRDRFAAGGRDDDERPLTATGRRRMRENASGLRRIVPRLSVLASSPLTRAWQTAELVAAEYRMEEPETLEPLRPDRHPRELVRWLATHPAGATVAVVGHEPSLGILTAWCLAGATRPMVAFKKGGAALVEFTRKPAAGAGRLLWLLTPSQLRAAAR
jgi:phosphohistidine phosphatase